MNIKFSTFALLSAAILSACGDAGTGVKLDNSGAAIDMGMERLGNRNAVRAGGAQFSDGIFVAASPERNNASAMLPAHLQTPSAISLKSRDPMSLQSVAQRLSEITGILHVVAVGPTGQISSAPDDVASASDVLNAQANGAGSETQNATSTSRRSAAADQSAEADFNGIKMRPDLTGSLSDVLDKVTATFHVEWAYVDGRVIFRDYVTRKYQITALPTTSTSATAIGSNSITSTSAMASDVWAEVRESLAGLIGEGSNVSIGSTTGLVTVTAKVSDQNRVKEYVEQLNGSMGQQIGFDVYVLTVTLNEANSAGVDLGAALARGTSGAARFGSSVFNSSGEIGSYNIGLLSGDVSIGAVVNALSSQGKVAVTTRAGTTTSNNRVAPIEVVDQYAYLKEVTIEEKENGEDRIVRKADTVTTGFQMQLFPRVMNNREIMVQYTVRLSELNDIKTFGEGNDAVQLPEISTTSFEQQAMLQNGQTLVLAGFERERVTADKRNGANLANGFGKSIKHESSRVATVMMITPRLISRNK